MKKRNEHAVIRVVIVTGIASVVTQLLTIREFLAQFKGNEYVIALILFSWLMLGGLGTLTANTAARMGLRATTARLGGLSILLAALAAVQLLLIRGLRDMVFIHGSSVGFYPTFFFIFSLVSPYGLLVGFLLPYSLFVLRGVRPDFAAANIYIADNLGDVAGGALFSFVLVVLLSPLKAAGLSGALLVMAALPLFRDTMWRAVYGFLGACAAVSVLALGIWMERDSLAPSEGELVYYQESRYGRIAVHRSAEQVTLFSDGTPLFSNQNLVAAEEAVHYPLSQIEKVENLLVISSEGGMMAEIAKYNPRTVDLVELDPEISKVLLRFGLIESIPGMEVIHQDGRAYLRDTRKRYDAVILNLPEPETFQLNRFYTEEFFSLVKRRLAPGGIFSFTMEGYDNYVSDSQRRQLSSLYHSAKSSFGHVRMLPGQRIFFLCSDRDIRTDIPALLARRSIQTEYISRYFAGNLTGERIEELNALVDPDTPKNRDAEPILLRYLFSGWFDQYATSPLGFFVGFAVLSLVYLRRLHAEELVLFTSGCMGMGFELLVIFAFQIYFGYIYHRIGLIVTVFLAGLLPGAWLGVRLQGRGRAVLVSTDIMLILMTALFIIVIRSGWESPPEWLFLVMGFAVSLACGCQVPAVIHLRGGDNPAAARSFSADLMGAACGALLTSVTLIPYLGVSMAACGLIVLKCLSLALSVRERGRRGAWDG
ncbi:MAG: hypothetical protein ACOZF0_15085 [Thermodesulfobacteriota bacterium]